ncbi:basic leucine zipper transcriptional factor ATF-like 2 isoform X1 [Molossus molossus]|uniref:Basic leucine zipper transcriptional factor ATF-like 2 n=2 Tax=Molossus molossus TaxID=27622 RepID=A0A7J8EPI5_MOLMO|nr:basic leucine zipper transcriptional factor ATF-like 2 isoform X1 [Molossus molossus]KAF6436972.1 basic leucine zipper ATF-like transcription factor 2 [Molossus molossus]
MRLCGGEGLLTGMDPEGHQRQLKKKQKNRASAQRSRKKHTDKADALHQQHESLEKHNHALQKEIRGLQAELAWWSQALRMHECLCLVDCASCLAPLPPGFWSQAKQPLDPGPHRQHDCQEQVGLFQTPVSSPSAHQLSPDLQPPASSGLLSPLPSLSLGSTTITAPPAQLSSTPVQSASPSGSSLLRPSSKLKALLPSSSAQPAPPQPCGPEHLTRGKLMSSPHSPSAALGLACLQDTEHKPLSVADQQGLGVELSPHPLLAFPLLSSAQVHF